MKEKISVIVCTYNRVKFIPDALDHLVQQDLDPSEYEIIIINNNSTDNTEQIVTDYIKHNTTHNFRQVFESNQGLSFARNRGLKESKHPLICYIDDDGYASSNYLSSIQNIMNDNAKIVGIGGKVIPQYEDKEPEWYNPYLRMMVTAIDFGDKPFKCYGKKYPAGCSMIYRKHILEEAGGFNNDLKWRADDKYIYHQVKKISDEVYYRPDIWVHHQIDKDRTTDQNFDRLSGLLGSEERLRILGKKAWAYPFKLAEFIFKYFASIILAIGFALKGQAIKGKYTIRFRWLALLRYLGV